MGDDGALGRPRRARSVEQGEGRPGVDWLHKHRIPRPLGVAIHYLGLLGLLALFLSFVVPDMISQVQGAMAAAGKSSCAAGASHAGVSGASLSPASSVVKRMATGTGGFGIANTGLAGAAGGIEASAGTSPRISRPRTRW